MVTNLGNWEQLWHQCCWVTAHLCVVQQPLKQLGAWHHAVEPSEAFHLQHAMQLCGPLHWASGKAGTLP